MASYSPAHPLVRRAGAVLAGLLLGALPVASPDTAEAEVRALWVVRTTLTSPRAIDALVVAARAHGFNTLLVQVRGRGDAYFTSDLEPRAASLAQQPPTFDPLATLLDAAHAEGLQVHAWVNVSLVSSAVTLPSSRSHVIYRHPEWLMVPEDLADELHELAPRSPAYIGKIARWSREHAGQVEGLYLSPLSTEAATYTAEVVADLAERYAVDGIHFDYVRFPSPSFDYSRDALAAFRAQIAPRVPIEQRLSLDARATVKPTTYAERFPDQWERFRRSRLTALVMRLRTAVKRYRPEALTSAAVVPDATDASETRFQDWRTWVDSGLIDVICPMAYTLDATTFTDQIRAAREVVGGLQLWAGIGAYRLSAEQTIARIAAARQLGADGIALFSYDSLVDPTQHPVDYLIRVGREAFDSRLPVNAGSR